MTETTKKYPIDRIRNIGIIAHIDAGKTTTTETILFLTGRKHRIGKIDEGTTEMDWMEQEKERGITITSAATTCFWKAHRLTVGPLGQDEFRINIIDTPGHVDFTAEVERSLRVLDGGVVVFDGKEGVEAQSETVWRQASRYNVPRLCYINKLNLVGGNFYKSLESIQKKLKANAAPVQLPIGTEYELKGVVDLITRKAYVYGDEEGLTLKEVPVPEEMKGNVEKYRAELTEKTVEHDEELLEKFLTNEELSDEELARAVRKATLSVNFFPVLGGDGRRVGVETLLDAILQFLPSPIDLPPVTGINPQTKEEETRKPLVSEPLAALAFKIQTDPYVGRLTYVRVYSGLLESGSYVLNATSNKKERVSRLLLMHANDREEIKSLEAGEIGAVVGLKATFTGDTLSPLGRPLVLEQIKFPEPVIAVAIEPKTKADQEKLGLALGRLAEEDPTFKIRVDEETGQTIISGMGELHLEILVDRLKREFNVGANVGRPQVAYRETIRRTVEQEGKYIRQSGGRGQYGHVLLRLEPLERGEGFEFVDEIKGGAIPKEFIPAVEKGVKAGLEKGVLAGYELIDLKATVFDGSFHEVDSSDIAFQIAAEEAFREGAKKANPVLLEPIMELEVTTPEKFTGEVIGDLSSKRAQIEGTEITNEGTTVIKALVPLAEMFGYSTRLRSLTQGRATFNMEPSHYEEVPSSVAEEIISR
jgi:elongation factor G